MRVGLIVLSVLLLPAGETGAQSDRASMTGTIRDAGTAFLNGDFSARLSF
jgi:hypothetical protein